MMNENWEWYLVIGPNGQHAYIPLTPEQAGKAKGLYVSVVKKDPPWVEARVDKDAQV